MATKYSSEDSHPSSSQAHTEDGDNAEDCLEIEECDRGSEVWTPLRSLKDPGFVDDAMSKR